MYKSQGFISMSKRLFYEFFKKAWEASFISQNIEFARGATGIWPFTNHYREKDASTSLSDIKGVGGVGGVRRAGGD